MIRRLGLIKQVSIDIMFDDESGRIKPKFFISIVQSREGGEHTNNQKSDSP